MTRAARGSLRTDESLDRVVEQFEIAKGQGYTPSIQELSDALDVPYTSVREIVLLLVGQGRLVKLEGVHRGVRLP